MKKATLFLLFLLVAFTGQVFGQSAFPTPTPTPTPEPSTRILDEGPKGPSKATPSYPDLEIRDEISVMGKLEHSLVEPIEMKLDTEIRDKVYDPLPEPPSLPNFRPKYGTRLTASDVDLRTGAIQFEQFMSLSDIRGTGFVVWLTQYGFMKPGHKIMLIVTNAHVVGKQKKIRFSNKYFNASGIVEFVDRDHDIALIRAMVKTKLGDLPHADFTDPEDGREVISIGYPLRERKASSGTVKIINDRSVALLRLYSHKVEYNTKAGDKVKLTSDTGEQTEYEASQGDKVTETHYGMGGCSGSVTVDSITGQVVGLNIARTYYLVTIKGSLAGRVIELAEKGLSPYEIRTLLGPHPYPRVIYAEPEDRKVIPVAYQKQKK